MNREDVCCPACPDPETAFRLEDVGVKHHTDMSADGMTFTVSRPAWEDLMLIHLEMTDDEAHRRVYLECMVALDAAGMSPDDVARQDVHRVADSARRLLDASLRR